MSKAEMIRYLPKLAYKRNSMPLYITYFVTNRCNLSCEHCFYSSQINQTADELSPDEIEQMTKTMGNFPVLLYSGGEPFIRKDLAEITLSFVRNCKINYLSIPTNGTFTKTTVETTDRICELCPGLTVVINFSIDGLEEEHNRIRGSARSFKSALETFEAVKRLKSKHANLRTGFVITFTQSNQDTIEELYDFLKAQAPDSISVNLIRGTPKNPLVKNVDIEKFKALTNRLKEDLDNSSLPGHDEFLAVMGHDKYDMVVRTFEENAYQTVCYASRIAGVIYPDGEVYPCEMFDKSMRIGNVREFGLDFRKLWMSERNREIARQIVKSKCFCTHECNVHCNTAFNTKHFTKIAFRAAARMARKAITRK